MKNVSTRLNYRESEREHCHNSPCNHISTEARPALTRRTRANYEPQAIFREFIFDLRRNAIESK